ncbi:hypothetical protein [Streptosporangium minutum]|uniref:Cysteinyl-tRNA ligase anticodon binding domain-containing protein n=2 Tax=Streptosporangium TaxID=2000 RepID=A0A243RN71_9ACTN|nr:hypothetical protein [Streptosporangium minutum]OUC96407.1 hypothetical protein CA984_15245 [Streptosporangium minutum]
MQDRPGVLVLMGSGETSPTMVEVHRSVVRRLGGRPRAVLLDTPYAFQENAADISSRARRYFARSVGLDVEVGTEIAGADWVFSGPGSPTFALDRWTATPVAAELRGRVRARDGATVLASAAACTAGVAAVPVYEIYKVGAEPHWREGLDLLGALGLQVAVIPHYDNAEGGTHDTRYCYLGERRLAFLERLLPPDAAVLGIDEHTAVVFDLRAESVQVAGRGGLTVRRPGSRTLLPAGTATGLAELRRLIRGGGEGPGASPVPAAPPAAGHVTLGELTRACEQRFGAALGAHDAAEATQAVLDLETEITRWAADTEEDEGGVDEAREILRHLVTGLGRLADTSEPRDRLAPLVEPLLRLRERLREQEAYDSADGLREALAAGGVSIEDGPDGPRWTVRG